MSSYYRTTLLILAVVAVTMMACSPDEEANGPPTPFPAELVGTWVCHSATSNGAPISIGELLNFAPGSDTADITVYNNGGYVYVERDTSYDTTYTSAGTVTASGNNLTLIETSENGVPVTPSPFLAGTYVLSGTQLTLTTTILGDVIVAVLVKKE